MLDSAEVGREGSRHQLREAAGQLGE